MKICSKCKIDLSESDFTQSQLTLRSGQCKICIKEYNKIYRITNIDIISKKQKEYYINNKNYVNNRHKKYRKQNISKIKEINRQYRLNNKNYNKIYWQNNKNVLNEKKREYVKNRYHNDVKYKIRILLSRAISKYFKNKNLSKNGKSCFDYLPYTMEQLKQHLESHFESWMTWNNQGKYNKKMWNDHDISTWTWQIAHIIPHSTFNYTSTQDEEFKKCWALDNLRPYSAKQNLLDGRRY